jgi:hypothetical protein
MGATPYAQFCPIPSPLNNIFFSKFVFKVLLIIKRTLLVKKKIIWGTEWKKVYIDHVDLKIYVSITLDI